MNPIGKLFQGIFSGHRSSTILLALLLPAWISASGATGSDHHETIPSRSGCFSLSESDLKKAYPDGPVCLVPVIDSPPTIDGDPKDEAWKKATPLDFVYLDMYAEGKPKIKTNAKMVSDLDHVYVLFICQEPNPGELQTNNKALWQDDICDFLIDVGRSQDISAGNYFIIEVNPIGKTATLSGDGRPWAPPSFKAGTKVLKDKWIVEVKIGFKDLGIRKANFPRVWGVNVARYRTVGRRSARGRDVKYFEFAWRGNYNGKPHIPDRFGVAYFQAGNRIPEELAGVMTKKNPGWKEDLGIYRKERAAPAPIRTPRKVKAAFQRPPQVKTDREKAIIEFSVQDFVDARVTVLDEKGEAVRHLAGGMLGKNAPAPFTAGSLEQKVEWDFKDDFGKPVGTGEYKVAVDLGMKAAFDKVLYGEPNRLSLVQGLCVDKEGVVYVLTRDSDRGRTGHYHVSNIVAFDREGRFVRHVLPFPARLPADSVRGARVLKQPDGRWMPVVYQGMLHPFVPQMGSLFAQKPAVTNSGRLVMANSLHEAEMRVPKRLLLIGTDGSVPEDYLGPLMGREPYTGRSSIALSPDDKYAYVTGTAGRYVYSGKSHQVVYRFNLKDGNPPLQGEFPKPFIGEFEVSGSDNDHFNNPSGIAVDGEGNVLVADTGNDRIAVFDECGSFLRSIAVKNPLEIEVHRKNGAIYVLSKEATRMRLVKLRGLKKPQEMCAMEFPWHKGVAPAFCLDSATKQPVLWVVAGRTSVHKVIDAGHELKDLGDVIQSHASPKNKKIFMNAMQEFEVDHSGRKLYVDKNPLSKHRLMINYGKVIDATSGALLKEEPVHYHRGRDGRLYTLSGSYQKRVISRFKPDLTPDPFEKTKVITSGKGYFLCVDSKGCVYFATSGHVIKKFNPDGTMNSERFISMIMPRRSSGQVATLGCDAEGFLYVACSLKNPNEIMPAFFRNRLPRDSRVSPGPWLFYKHYYGSIAKFSPQGGKVELAKDGDLALGTGPGARPCRVEGLEWLRLGMSPISSNRNADHAKCMCEHASFGMDLHDRIFIPDAYRFSVNVIDKNGNPITRFGKYGNMDSCRADSPDGEPDIGLAWPLCVRVTDDACFIADKINHRIIRVNLLYEASKEVGVMVKSEEQ